MEQIVVFNVGEEIYGADVSQVKEIVKITKITPIPNVADHIEGVVNLRGQIVTTVNLSKKLNIESYGSKMIIVLATEKNQIGVMVDEVSDVIWLDKKDIEEAPKAIGGMDSIGNIRGIGKRNNEIIILLDLIKMFAG